MPVRSTVTRSVCCALVWGITFLLPGAMIEQQPLATSASPAPDLEKRVRGLEEIVRQMQADRTHGAVIPAAEQIPSKPSPGEQWTTAPAGDAGGSDGSDHRFPITAGWELKTHPAC